jgi:glycosyltransferase involved in cell wall biosynthesis
MLEPSQGSLRAGGRPAGDDRIRVLYVTLWGDRPEVETCIGLKARGCDVRVCCMPNSPHLRRFERAGIDVVKLPFHGRVDLATIRGLRAELRGRHIDILHLLHNRAISNGLLAVRGFNDVKVIAYRGMVGNVSFLDPTSWLRHLHPRVDRIVCVAEAVRQSLLEVRFLGYRLPPEKLVTIHKGHDLGWYAAAPADLGQFDIPAGAFVIGSVANWRRRKGLEILLDAFAQLPAELPIYVLLAGHMRSRRLQRAVARHTFAQRIRNLGFRTDAPSVIAACQVSVLPSTKREGLPKTVIEAMANGVPPIVTDCGGSPELVVDGESGLVVPPGDAARLAEALFTLYRDKALRERMGQQARERIRVSFNIDNTVDATLAMYRDVLRDDQLPSR